MSPKSAYQLAAYQLGLALSPRDPNSLKYFVPHSGVSDAANALSSAVQSALGGAFSLVYLYGPPGTGKSHLAHGYRQYALESGIPAERIEVLDFGSPSGVRPAGSECSLPTDSQTIEEFFAANQARFVARYEELKAAGGIMVITAPCPAQELSSDPHLLSRLRFGSSFCLSYPLDEELEPIIRSLAERENLRLTDAGINYLLERLPGKPLSFADILAKIASLSSLYSKPAGMRVIREAVSKSALPLEVGGETSGTREDRE